MSNSTSKWNTYETKLSPARRRHSVTALNDNQMIIKGGFDGKVSLKKVEVLDVNNPKTSIISLPDMVSERKYHSSILFQNYLYVIGGFGNKSVHRLDVSKKNTSLTSSSTNKWETDVIPDMDEESSI